MVEYLADLVDRYPIVSIEDGMAEDDWDGWKLLTDALGRTLPARRRRSLRDQHRAPGEGIDEGIANSILVKVNQIGSLTETLDAVDMAQRAGYTRGDVASLGRDRRRDHRGPRGRDQLRADQDRLAVALRPSREVQPAHPHRGRRSGGFCTYPGRTIFHNAAELLPQLTTRQIYR